MKIFFAIIAVFAIIIFVLFSAKIKLKIYLSKDGYIVVKYLFLKLRYDFYGDNNLKPKNKGEAIPQKNKKSKAEKQGYIKKTYAEQGAVEGTIQILSVIKLVFLKFANLITKSSAEYLNLNIDVASDDAATTAMYYGSICAVVYPAVGLLNGIIPIKKQNICINADYSQNNTSVQFELFLSLRVYKSLSVVFSLIKEFLQGGF